MEEDDLKTTVDPSKSTESDTPTDDSTVTPVDDSDGKATDDNDSAGADSEDKSRGERKHERYIDRLSKEIQESNSRDDSTGDLFSPNKSYQPIDYKEGSEYDPSQLEEDRLNFGKNRFSEGLGIGLSQGTQQVNTKLWQTNFDIDSERVMAKYESKLDPETEKDLVNSYIGFIGIQKDPKGRLIIDKPNIRFKDFAEAEFDRMDKYVERQKEASTTNIVKQSRQTGIRPNGQGKVTTPGNGFDDSSPEAAIKSVAKMTSDQYFKQGGREASDAYLAKYHKSVN